MNLITKRLLIRSLQVEDAADLAAIWTDEDVILRNDADVTEYMGSPRDYEQTLQDLKAEAGQGEEDPADTLYPVIEQASGRLIGDCGFIKKEVDGEAETELIYVFAKEVWARGYATEAARALCTFAFERLKLRRLIALIDPQNGASARVAEKAGMEFWKKTVRPTGKSMHVYRREIR
jgi:RimJ/RimL family protein N-acetyltransferase